MFGSLRRRPERDPELERARLAARKRRELGRAIRAAQEEKLAARGFVRTVKAEWPESGVCRHCRQPFSFRPRRRALAYCGPGCRLKGRRAVLTLSDRYVGPGGYVYRRPARGAAHTAEHVMVAQAYLQRPLEPGEHVRHLDGDRTNNDPVNLAVWRKNRRGLRPLTPATEH